MVVLTSTTLSMVPGATVVRKSNTAFEDAPGTPLGVQLAAVLQFVLALTPGTAFHTDCAPAGRADEMTAATIAGNQNIDRSRIFFMGLIGGMITAVTGTRGVIGVII